MSDAGRLIVSYAREEAFIPFTRVILTKLGYEIVPFDAPGWDERGVPDLCIVDERRMAELDSSPENGPPMIVLTGRHGVSGVDPRVIGAVRKPAGLHELYRLIQQAVEDYPRATPRIPTHIAARCEADGREWRGSVISLSENGCLLRSPEPVQLGSELKISFELPRIGPVETIAESAYQLVPDLGLVFHRTPAPQRNAIAHFVEQTLAQY